MCLSICCSCGTLSRDMPTVHTCCLGSSGTKVVSENQIETALCSWNCI
jgi:hypothetical protein